MRIRGATAEDLVGVVALERACATAAHWTEEQYRRILYHAENDGSAVVLIAEETAPPDAAMLGDGPGNLVGFLVARHVADEWELENIVVETNLRQNGHGTQLLKRMLVSAKAAGSEAVFLEMRESNTAARKLYEKAGFAEVGRRRNYYKNPEEDALLYRYGLR